MQQQIYIELLKKTSSDLPSELNNLLMQLDHKAKPLTKDDITFMISSSANRLFVAKKTDTNEIVGMVTMIAYRTPFTKKGILEDFVVDEMHRGKGIGTMLITFAIEQARKEAVEYLDFTSRPSREAANRLYRHLGFQKRDTNVYRIEI